MAVLLDAVVTVLVVVALLPAVTKLAVAFPLVSNLMDRGFPAASLHELAQMSHELN